MLVIISLILFSSVLWKRLQFPIFISVNATWCIYKRKNSHVWFKISLVQFSSSLSQFSENITTKCYLSLFLNWYSSSSSLGSATSLEESRESTPSTNVLTKKYESDIEILSNPSQSSIEVLDETLKLVTAAVVTLLFTCSLWLTWLDLTWLHPVYELVVV